MIRAPGNDSPSDTNASSRPRLVKQASGSPVITEAEAEARLHLEGFHEVFRWHDVAGSEYPSHHHGDDECLWVLEGRLELTVENESFQLDPGDRLYLPGRLAHTAEVPRNQGRGTTYLIGQKKSRPRSPTEPRSGHGR